ncbi:MAG TPA: tRNA (N(6)-L-threonylcarbamoyladenosine(37)-C(2))-methylthiotransferase MtaB [Sedimentisphaerales bacterium]|jgi:threonylcarbamoyladenosine tRNA methylthiotransferase MtaB|nr:tRNA (N(6)-L-threonylcarbamoyladenosine(37)-C(2))-methylthiotransferase MtaB [Sedimentisphaerales bacterium]HNU28245.1 tRNA (N(6)-L-threonylcarbamoyladenosine(37)-C(2))-methylthiotransferase MtaB [Sedimentisphaerales bacterium]
MMTSFAILTLGCKVNQYESQQIRQLLESCGLRLVDLADSPELVVVNSCCVTHTASAKSRHLLHQAGKQNPQAIILCGCLPAAPTGELTVVGENIHVVKDRCELPATLSRLARTESTTPDSNHPATTVIRPQNDAKVKSKNDLHPDQDLPALASFHGQTRAFLKIQDGCDGPCLYCIIPTVRPVVRFRNPGEILAEARALVAAGHKEIVITGVHVGAYGQTTARRRRWSTDENPHLADLLDKVAQVPGLARVRVSSLDPADVTPRLLDVFGYHPNLMPHLHLSLQSGSDAVLRRMARPYSADEFRTKVALVKDRLDRPAITTDIIVGFPGETDAEFEETVALAREVGFAKMHVFAFSPRKGTAAATMRPQVAPPVIKARSKTLRDLDRDLQTRFRAQFLGETAQVLIEESADGSPAGRAERYFEVRIGRGTDKTNRTDRTGVSEGRARESYPSESSYSPGEIVAVRLDQNSRDAVLATAIPQIA